MSSLSRGTQAQHETHDTSPEEKPAKNAVLAGSDFFRGRAPGGELNDQAPGCVNEKWERKTKCERIETHLPDNLPTAQTDLVASPKYYGCRQAKAKAGGSKRT